MIGIRLFDPSPPGLTGREVIGQEQLNILIAECDELGTDKRKLCKYFGVPSMADLTPDQFAEAMAQLARKRKAIEDGDAQGESEL